MYVDDPGSMSESARTSMGITKTLPKKLPEAWQDLQEDKAMVEILGENFVESYLSVKKVCCFRLI